MKIFKKLLLTVVAVSLLGLTNMAYAKGVVVTKENFIHADSVRAYLKELAKTDNKVNVITPMRELTNADTQDVIRMNEDTLYERVILDVKGGATVSSKEYEGFQNILVLDPNHSQVASITGAGTIKLDESMLTVGHHAYIIVRTGLLRNLPKEEMMKKAHEAQDNISITYHSSEPYVPSVNYDFSTMDKVKYKILKDFALKPQKDVVKNGAGTMKDRDPDAARVVIAIGWGILSKDFACYSSFTGKGDRQAITFKKPDLKYGEKGFFSFTIYNQDGYIATINYAINSDNMVPNKDGSYTVNFLASGEPVKGLKNVVRTPRGKFWTGVMRAYSPKNPDETFKHIDAITGKMTKEFMK
ncbi:hypothetical protein MNB_SV-10-1146 [hydrothermal vent metagenome]|uniref:DUF1214 domain-containing protein n=1 Tax=hydrothermal vent metagenome TaxID=652676 RepID=A0A1W1C684_9ZZZZ